MNRHNVYIVTIDMYSGTSTQRIVATSEAHAKSRAERFFPFAKVVHVAYGWPSIN